MQHKSSIALQSACKSEPVQLSHRKYVKRSRPLRAEIQKDIESARLNARELINELHQTQLQSRRWWCSVFGLMAGAGLFAAGVFAGMFLR